MAAAEQKYEYFEPMEPLQMPEDVAKERVYSYREKVLRDSFVREYLTDFDAIAAACRIGYNKSIAKDYAVRLMDEPYVQRAIAKLSASTEADADTEEMVRKRIIAALMREANDRGPGSTQAARVAALGKLAQLHGMEPATKTKTELTGPNGEPLQGPGQFVIPGVMTPEQWAAAAKAQQADLVAGKIAQVEQVAPPQVD